MIKLPTLNQWRQFFKVFNKKEKVFFLFLFYLFIASSLFLLTALYLKNTKVVPKDGGSYAEGIVGFPRFINPIYSASSDVDRDLTALIFSGLLKTDSSGDLVPDLAEDYKSIDNGKVYDFTLRKNIFFQDKKPLTADDVVFTVKTIQNPDVKSPLRISFIGVEVEKLSDYEVRFTLENPSAVFLQSLTVGIIPKHVFEKIPIENFYLTKVNIEPIGSGPYRMKSKKQDRDNKITFMKLVASKNFYGKKPYIKKIGIYFFSSEQEMVKNYERKRLNGFSLSSFSEVNDKGFSLRSLSLPRYFAVFFNLDNSPLFKIDEVRQALNYGTNKEELIKSVLGGKGKAVDSPVLPDVYNFDNPSKTYHFDVNKAVELLESKGFVKGDNGLRAKKLKQSEVFSFKTELKLGSTGNEVRELQKCLNIQVTGYFGNETKNAVVTFQENHKEEILIPSGIDKGTGTVKGLTREILNKVCLNGPKDTLPLKFTLRTGDDPLLIKTAESLKEKWRNNLGIDVEVATSDIYSLELDVIKPRQYEALLFGQILGSIPDPFPFWHSSEKSDPGLNLSLYENKKADGLLENSRQNPSANTRRRNLEDFQEILIKDAPAVFLYNPYYLYYVSKEIKGIDAKVIADPSKRFSNIVNWYIKTRRVFK